ncbi:SHUGOSHIN 1-like [Olea europaea var. sylvestris]|uniref:SHUGOSHIN 1-like n=1 Tax=Olea europaea var. sylvestris TaxID=158386 RepID=UPI000C1D2311|nr:SHUGOSHIN 1-like [Olea europaea var. sylvestris]
MLHILGVKEPEDYKTCNANRRCNARNQSLGPLPICQQVVQKEAGESKRRCLRRQSASSRIQQQEPNENLFEIEDVKFPVAMPANSPACADGSPQVSSSNKKEEFDRGHDSDFETQESRRTSITRPMRRAVEKVQSYKERPVNIKMRRT